MKKAAYNILPGTEEILKTMGEQIKLARLRRSLSAELVAERAGISRATLWKVEKGDPSVAMGIYAAVLHALNNLDKDFLLSRRMMTGQTASGSEFDHKKTGHRGGVNNGGKSENYLCL